MYEFKELYTLDFTNVNTYYEFHFLIKDELDFPDYYGCNWDAFWDCLSDMIGDPIHIQILGFDNIERKFGALFAQTMLRILKKAKHFDHDRYAHEINIELVNGKHRVIIE